jgi:hypothetical protein
MNMATASKRAMASGAPPGEAFRVRGSCKGSMIKSESHRITGGFLLVLVCLLLAEARVFGSGEMGSFSYRGQRVIEASIAGVDEGGVVIRGKDTGLIIVPLEDALKIAQLKVRLGAEIQALMESKKADAGAESTPAASGSPRAPNGAVFYRSSTRSGPHSVLVENNSTRDGVIKLVSPKRPYTFAVMHVGAGMRATLRDIQSNSYKIVYALGGTWDRLGRRVAEPALTGEFPDLVVFSKASSGLGDRAKIFLHGGASDSTLQTRGSSGAESVGRETSLESFDAYELE